MQYDSLVGIDLPTAMIEVEMDIWRVFAAIRQTDEPTGSIRVATLPDVANAGLS